MQMTLSGAKIEQCCSGDSKRTNRLIHPIGIEGGISQVDCRAVVDPVASAKLEYPRVRCDSCCRTETAADYQRAAVDGCVPAVISRAGQCQCPRPHFDQTACSIVSNSVCKSNVPTIGIYRCIPPVERQSPRGKIDTRRGGAIA